MRPPVFKRAPLHRVAVLLVGAGLALTGCSKAPPQVLAATPAGNPLAPGLCGDSRAVPGLGASQLQAAYQAPALFGRSVTGAGTTIAVIVPYTNLWIASDVAAYSRRNRLPLPDVQVIDWQHAPPARPNDPDQAGWAQEGALDLEMAHVLAPAARLIYLEVPAGNGAAYVPALTWLVTHQRVTVVSMSEGIPEAWLPGAAGARVLAGWRGGLRAAARAGMTIVAGIGDFGAAQPQQQNPRPAGCCPVGAVARQ